MCIINAGKVVVVNVKLLYLTTVMADIVWCGSSRTSCTPSLATIRTLQTLNMRNLIIGLFILVSTNSVGQDYQVFFVNMPLDLSGFEDFIDNEKSTPLKKINYYQNRKYSNDFHYYLESTELENVIYLKNKNGDLIKEINGASIKDIIIWLDKCVIIDRFYKEPNKKILIDLQTGRQTIYKTTEKFRYTGQSDTLCYFYSIDDYSYFDSLFLKSRYSIVSLNENGALIEYNNPTVISREMGKSNITGKDEWKYTYSDSVITFTYYNKQVSSGYASGYENIGHRMAQRYFRNYDSAWIYPDRVDYFDMEKNVWYQDGMSYALINDKAIYRFGDYNVTKIIDCEDLAIQNFRIEDNFLIFTSKSSQKNRPIGILDLDTKKTYYPKVTKK